MQIFTKIHIPFPRALVYATYRDKLLDLIPYLPNVRNIEVKSRSEQNGRVYIVNEWHGGGEIPAAARALLSEAMLSWTDRAVWNDQEFSTNWRIETHAFTEAVHCSGRNLFQAEAEGTVIVSEGELHIDSHQIHGVPGFVAHLIGGVVEDFLSHKIEPNLVQLGEGVQHYLEQHPPAG
uniref:Cyclase/dehydrase n=1 Tax=Cyanothece sp. (strain PCC 7425 / ATCC 29141) TaxID=395961 RepID=B8HTV7_CYAP4